MTTTWEITKNEIKRSQQPTPDSDQFHTTDKSHFYRTIDDVDQSRWDHNTDRIYLLGHGKESQFLDSCSKVLQITEDGQWVEGRMGAGVSLEVNSSHKFPYSEVPKDLATKYFDEFQVETNVLKRNDIYLVEYGANEDKAKLFTFPHSDQSETKVQAMTKPYSNLQITKLVEDGKPVNGFEVTPEIENILVKTNQLTDEQHKDIQMAIVDDSLESALSDLVDDTTQLGR